MQALILVGGLGTRLRPLVNDRPKPMANVLNKPFIEYVLSELFKNGIKDIIFALGYKGNIIEEYFGNGNKYGIHIHYSYEKEQLGTAGAIKNALQYIKEEYIFILNGDTFFKLEYNEFLKYSLKLNFDMSIVLRKVNDISRYGEVILKDNYISKFNEKSIEFREGLINGGIYLLTKKIISEIPDGKCSIENDMLPKWLSSGKKICGYINNRYFIDIGIPTDYLKFIRDVKDGRNN